MRRVLLSVLAVTVLAGQASAGLSFTLDKSAALKLSAVQWSDAGGLNMMAPPTDDVDVYQTGGPMQGQVGFYGGLDDTDGNLFAWVRIGVGDYPGGVGAVIGTNDLSSYDDYRQFLANDEDDIWQVRLYVQTSSEYAQTPTWHTLAPGENVVLSLSLGGISGLNDVTDIGFLVGGSLTGLSDNPSDPDVFHISTVVPLPGAAILGLLGFAVAGLRLRKQT